MLKLLVISAIFIATGTAVADVPPGEIVGYIDADGDGRNDRFRDADGDGRNDVTDAPYAHHFTFEDADGDGVNDRFRDADGDGINDVDGRVIDVDEDGICDNVLDADGDGRNDITGVEVGQALQGWRYGRVDEDAGLQIDRFLDHDGDGMHDPWASADHRRPMDLFIDEDGDGIADGRAIRGGMDALHGLGTLRIHGPRAPRDDMPRGAHDDDEDMHGRRHGRR